MRRHLGVASILTTTLLMVSAATSLPVRATTSQSTARETGCRGLDPYLATSAERETCDVQSFPLTAVNTLAGGGKEYVYMVGGLKTVYRIPPPAFDPLSATSQQLQAYGLPPRPSSGPALKDWEAMMRHQKFVHATPFIAQTTTKAESGCANCWAGYEAVASTYTYVQGQWDEFQALNSCSGSWIAVWAGIGGDGTPNLAQDGTGYNFVGANHQAWYDILPAGASPVPVYANPGWRFTAITQWVGNGWYFYVYDSKYGDAWNGTVYTSSHDLSTAEFIAEDPPGHPLLNFSYLRFRNGYVNGTGSGNEIGHYPNGIKNAYNGNDLLAYPGSLSNSDPIFTDYYNRCN